MPHTIIEYSRTIENKIYINDLIKKLHETMYESELFALHDIKTRAIAFDHYVVGDEGKDFIAVTVKLLSGRDDETKSNLSTALHACVRDMVEDDVVVTVDIRDLNREAYSKGPK